jgi:serine/threonine-protein kinase
MGLPADETKLAIAANVGSVVAGRYSLVEELGRGATATVFRAAHTRLDRAFAVKVLHAVEGDAHRLRDRFIAEVEMLGRLRHLNIVGIVDAGETDAGELYLVMEYANGLPLDVLIDGRPMDSDRVLRLALQMVAGLEHAHARGVIHRDFKPANIIIEREGTTEIVRIIDFGVAIEDPGVPTAVRHRRLTDQGLIVGTPQYMAPEHAMGLPIDARADLFSLGLVMFEMLAGRAPHDGEVYDVIRANVYERTPALAERVLYLHVDPVLEAFVHALLVKDPAQRIQSAREAHNLLALVACDRVAAARALGVVIAEPPRRRRSGAPPLQRP